MTRSNEDVRALIQRLRKRDGDFTEVEVKRAAGGIPNLRETLCAFGNMPEGGTIVLGLDESSGFSVVGIDDVHGAEQSIASQARTAVIPPVHVEFQSARVDGTEILFVDVEGLPLRDRPCRTKGKAYLRQADGDYELSLQEVQQLERLKLVGAEQPHDDSRPVDGTALDDLDPDLQNAFFSEVRAASRRLSQMDDVQVLRAKGVIEPRGDRLTVAGLTALGRYPQQFLPSYAITAAVQLPRGSGARTKDLVHLDGPLPDLLDDAIDWVRRNTSTRVGYDERGHARDEREFPARVVRELIANALVHRDLSPQTEGKRVEIRLTDDDLIISNPGGLHGITVRQLGGTFGKSAVNQHLYEIAKFTRIRDGARVIEGEGGGIREVQASLLAAGMSAPVFHDTGVSFVARVPRHALLGAADLEWLAITARDLPLSDLQRRLLVTLRDGTELTNRTVRDEHHIQDPGVVTKALQGLVDTKLVEQAGSGRGTRYRFASGGLIPAPMLHVEVEESPVAVTQPRKSPPSMQSPAEVTRHGGAIVSALDEPRTFAAITERTSLSEGQVRYALRVLIDAGVVRMQGAQGRRDTVYMLEVSADAGQELMSGA